MKGQLNMRKVIYPTFTADDWQLYSDEEDGYQPSKAVAIVLNDKLRELVNAQGSTASKVYEGMAKVMYAHRDRGADDTEPRAFLRELLEKIYYNEHDDWK